MNTVKFHSNSLLYLSLQLEPDFLVGLMAYTVIPEGLSMSANSLYVRAQPRLILGW